jgi:hypothetical protein
MHPLRPTAREKRDTLQRAPQPPLYAYRGSPHHDDVVHGHVVARGHPATG